MTSPTSDESDRPLLAQKGLARPAVQLPSRELGGEDALTASPRQTASTVPDVALADALPAAGTETSLPEAPREDASVTATPGAGNATEADLWTTESPPAGDHEAEPAPAASLSEVDLPVPSAITLEDLPRDTDAPISPVSPPSEDETLEHGPEAADQEAETVEQDKESVRTDLAAWRRAQAKTTAPKARRGSWLAVGAAMAAAIALVAVLATDLVPTWLMPGQEIAEGPRDLELATAGAGPEPRESAAVSSEAVSVAPLQTAALPVPDDGPAANIPARAQVDVIRVEPDGSAFIAGRAKPGTALLILDNDTIVGTVTADALGFWTFLSGEPLPAGDHGFALAVHSEMNPISLPAVPESGGTEDPEVEAPGSATSNVEAAAAEIEDETAAQPPSQVAPEAAPTPARKPDLTAESQTAGKASNGPYVIQLASVLTAEDAVREQDTLQERFSDLLEGTALFVDQATLEDHGEVFRLRSGPFANLAEARKACARFEARSHDCLVVRLPVAAEGSPS